MKKNVLLALIAFMFVACSKEEKGDLSKDFDSGAYLSMNFSSKSTKANTSDPGTAGESKITSSLVLLFDSNDICLGSVDFGAITVGTPTTAREVSEKTKKVFVVLNNYSAGWAFTDIVGKKWDDINTYANVTVADIATTNSFVMTNAGDKNGALVDVRLYPTPALAEAASAVIKVDRLSSKVKVSCPFNPDIAPNGTFSFDGWELNTVNKTTRLHSQIIDYANASTTVNAGIYRIDKNYLKSDFPTDAIALYKYVKDNYTWLKNGTSASDPTSPVVRAEGTSAYCIENTMDAPAQLWGHTTKIVVKAKYAPNVDIDSTQMAAGNEPSYFMYKGNYYLPATMKKHFRLNAQLKIDLMDFLAPLGNNYVDMEADYANIDAAIDALGEYAGFKSKLAYVRYYHKSVHYYDALIRHDSNVTTPMALGRYGVVRNNAYEMTITKVNGPGTPWIPDPSDPIDPVKPTDPDDAVDINLSITIKVNPWTIWSQDVELGD